MRESVGEYDCGHVIGDGDEDAGRLVIHQQWLNQYAAYRMVRVHIVGDRLIYLRGDIGNFDCADTLFDVGLVIRGGAVRIGPNVGSELASRTVRSRAVIVSCAVRLAVSVTVVVNLGMRVGVTVAM